MFCKAACEVFGIIESYFVCYLRYIHIVRQPVTDNKFPRKIQPVVTHELSGRLSRQILHFFVHQTFAYPHCFDEIAYFVIRVLIVFFHNLHCFVQELLVHWILFRLFSASTSILYENFCWKRLRFSSILDIRASSKVSSNGFKRYSSTPIRKLSMRDSLDVLAVSIRKGICEMAKLDFTGGTVPYHP